MARTQLADALLVAAVNGALAPPLVHLNARRRRELSLRRFRLGEAGKRAAKAASRRRRMNHSGAAVAVALGLVAVIAWEISDAPRADDPSPRPAAAPAASPAPAPAVDREREWVATALARPLFSPDRRPASVAATAATAGPSGPTRLTGTLVGPSERSAIFAVAGRDPIVVHEGARIDGSTVTSIEPGQVRLEGPEGTRILRPTFQPGPEGTPGVSVRSQTLGQAAVQR